MKFAFISAEKASAPVSILCRVLGVTRSGFYAWQQRAPSEQAIDDHKLALEIAAIYKASCCHARWMMPVRSVCVMGSPRAARDRATGGGPGNQKGRSGSRRWAAASASL